jgi:hypothetical protein
MSILSSIRFTPKDQRINSNSISQLNLKKHRTKKSRHHKLYSLDQEELLDDEDFNDIKISKRIKEIEESDENSIAKKSKSEISASDSKIKSENTGDYILNLKHQVVEESKNDINDNYSAALLLKKNLKATHEKTAGYIFDKKYHTDLYKLSKLQRHASDITEISTSNTNSWKLTENIDDDVEIDMRKNILRLKSHYIGTEITGSKSGVDEDTFVDTKNFGVKDSDKNQQALVKKVVLRNIAEEKKKQKAVENCYFCCDSLKFNKSPFIISQSENVIFCSKQTNKSLLENHCELFPVVHVSSIASCDAETLTDLNRYKQCIQYMFEKQFNKNALFIETAIYFDKKPHAVIEIIPVPFGFECEARMLFQQVENYYFIIINDYIHYYFFSLV